MKKNGFAPILIVLIIAILGAVGYLVYKNIVSGSQQPADFLTKISGEIRNTNGLNSSYLSLSKDNSGHLYWTSDDGYLIDVVSSQEVVGKYKCFTEGSSTEDSFTKIEPDILANINNLFISNSYQSKGEGFNPKILDSGKYDYTDQTANQFCQLIFDSGCSGPESNSYHILDIVCNNNEAYKQSYNNQIQELKDLGIKGSTLNQISNYGSFYVLDAVAPVSAGMIFLVQKTDKGWVLIDEGDGGFSCNKINKYKVPHQLKGAEQCFDSKGREVYNQN